MAQLNINRKTSDPFYRYKMPKLIAKVEGRGNGIKTVVSNMSDIARSLSLPPAYPTKYLGIELGAQVILDDKNNRYIVNGSHEDAKLQSLVFDFIEKYLLCPNCDNPETYMEARVNREQIKIVCKACGFRAPIAHNHKLNTYITKNPPSTDVKESLIAITPKVSNLNGENHPKDSRADSETTWFTDTSAEAVQRRMADLSTRAAEMTINPDLERPMHERVEMFQQFIKLKLDKLTKESIDQIFHQSKRLDIGDKAVLIVSSTIFESDPTIAQLKKHQDLLIKFCCSPETQMYFLHSLEILVSDKRLDVGDVIKMFKVAYDLDVVEEDMLIQWSNRKSKKYLNNCDLLKKLHESVAPLINWLKTAECESDDGDEDEVEFVSDDKPNVDEIKSISRECESKEDEESNDDLNIDDI